MRSSDSPGVDPGLLQRDGFEEYGPPTTAYNLFSRWSRKRFWTEMLETLATATDNVAIDTTYVKAQRSALGGTPTGPCCTEDRPIARWKHYENPCLDRCDRPSVSAPAHPRQHSRRR
jgi:transposase